MVGEILDIKNNSDSIMVIYNWDFGDGFSSDERNPIHNFTASGVYNIQLKVSNNLGNDENIACKIRVGERYIYEIELSLKFKINVQLLAQRGRLRYFS